MSAVRRQRLGSQAAFARPAFDLQQKRRLPVAAGAVEQQIPGRRPSFGQVQEAALRAGQFGLAAGDQRRQDAPSGLERVPPDAGHRRTITTASSGALPIRVRRRRRCGAARRPGRRGPRARSDTASRVSRARRRAPATSTSTSAKAPPGRAATSSTAPSRMLRTLIASGRRVASATSRARTRSRTASPGAAGDPRRAGHEQPLAAEIQFRHPGGLPMGCHPRGEQRSGLEAPRPAAPVSPVASVEALEHALDRSRIGDPAPVQQHHPVGDPGHFAEVVAHMEGGHPELRGEGAQPGEEAGAGAFVERRERFVEQQHRGAGEQGAAERDALPLPAGKPGGSAVEIGPESEPLHHFGERRTREAGVLRTGRAAPAAVLGVAEVPRHREVGEQGGLLEGEADPPPMRRQEEPPRVVLPDRAAGRHPAARRASPDTARSRVVLPLPEGPKTAGRLAGRSGEGGLDPEVPGVAAQFRLERAGEARGVPGHRPLRVFCCRLSVSATTMKEKASNRRRAGGRSPFHQLHMVVDGDREHAGRAGDVAADHQDDPELAHRVGESEHRPGDEAGRASGTATVRKASRATRRAWRRLPAGARRPPRRRCGSAAR